MLSFSEIKKWFDSSEWDIGYLTLEQLRICSLTPIKSIDDHIVSNGKAGVLTLDLQKLYYEIVRGEHEKYFNWLTFIN